MRITGAQVAGGLLPTYEVGGDWFDLVENRETSQTLTIKVDHTAPTIVGTRSPLANLFGWINQPVEVKFEFSAADKTGGKS